MKRHESFDELEEAIKIGRHRERAQVLRILREELEALRELGESTEYLNGFEHGIVLLEEEGERE
jgi:hypothetical protein